jgi:alkylation response protein AidB-like acyl-CoA dehydrogenase
LFRGIAGGQIITGIFGTEPGADLGYPRTTATPNGDGYVLNGLKIFGTLSPIANLIFSPLRVVHGEGKEPTAGMAMLSRDMPGMTIKDNWDALGMRASGSNDVVYEDVQISRGQLLGGNEPLGMEGPDNAEMAISGNLGLICAFMGIAEAARDIARGARVSATA